MSFENARIRDMRVFYQKKPSNKEYLRHAVEQSGRSTFSVVQEFIGLHMGRGKMTLPEYVQYGLYHPDLAPEQRSRFISNTLHWPITHLCCDMTWQAATEDKWLCSHFLKHSNVPVPHTLAVIDKTERLYPNTRKITTADELRDFAFEQEGAQFFGKENRGICGFGSFLVLEAEPERLHLKGEGWMDYQSCIDDFVGDTCYLLQPCQRNHSFFDKYTDNLATVRVCILMTKKSVQIPFAVLKLPAQDNLTDSFWRAGNLACNLDPVTGKILTARTKDPFGTQDHTNHPDSGDPLVGESVPLWDQLLKLVHNCSPIFAPVRYQSMDVAVTDQGPVLIEINTGGGFDLPQLASGEGFLTDEVCELFRDCGYKRI